MKIRRRSAALVAWALAISCLAGTPDYDAFSEADGYIATDQHQIAAWAVVRDPEQLEAVYRDATSGNLRALHVFQQLEATFSASGQRPAAGASPNRSASLRAWFPPSGSSPECASRVGPA